MNLKLLFSKAQSRYVLKNQVAFAESFLRFASYAEKDELIYPYWRVFDEAGKFFFIEECFLRKDKAGLIKYVIDNKESFWSYMLESSEFSKVEKGWGYDRYYCFDDRKLYYIPHFTVYLITLLSGSKGILGTFVPNSEKLAINISMCKEAKTYFEFVFSRLENQFKEAEYFGFTAIPGRRKTKNLSSMKKSIMMRMDKLIAKDFSNGSQKQVHTGSLIQ